MKIKNILTTMLLLIIMILPMFVGVGRVRAAVVTDSKTVYIYCDQCSSVTTADYKVNGFALLGDLTIGFQKIADLQSQNGSNMASSFNLNTNESVVLKSATTSTSADWFLNGGFYDSPPADSKWYKIGHRSDGDILMQVFKPYENNIFSLTSSNSNIVSCDQVKCTGIAPGTTTVTISFPVNPSVSQPKRISIGGHEVYYCDPTITYDHLQESKECKDWRLSGKYGITRGVSGAINNPIRQSDGSYILGADTTFDRGFWTPTVSYSFPSITYTVTVPPVPNTLHVSTCTGASAITKNSATVNWSYTDDDPLDVQTQYQVQLSTKSYSDSGFTNADIVFSSSSASSVTNHTFTGLTASTTYYSRVQTYNATNGWSGFSSCAFGFTTSPDDVPPGSPVCLCNGTRTLTCTTNGIATTTESNSSQCAISSYCSVATTTATTTFTFGPASNRIGNVKYDHSPGITATKNGPDYTYNYPIPKVDGVQSLTVILTDLADNSTTLPRTCSVTNTTPSVTTTPTINIIKSPRISLNKNSKCKLDWNIENMPENTTCTLSGFSTDSSLPLDFDPNAPSGSINFINSWTSPPLQQNTKYTISCTDGSLSVSKSAICRVNPSIGEI